MSWSDTAADAAWNALHPPVEDAPEPAVAADDGETPEYFPTEYEDVYVNEAGDYFHGEADAAGEIWLTPVDLDAAPDDSPPTEVGSDLNGDGVISDLEATVFASILEGLGIDYDTASEDQILAAVTATDEYVDELRATVRGDAAEQGHNDEVSAEQARSDAALEWADELGISPAEAAPYLKLAQQAVDAGTVPAEAALEIAADSVRKSQAASDIAHRETKYKGMGLSRGLDAAMDDVLARGPNVYKDTPSANNVVLGDAFDSALGDTLTQMSLEKAHQDVARLEADSN